MLLFNFLALVPLSPIFIGIAMLAVVVYSAHNGNNVKNVESNEPQIEVVDALSTENNETRDYLLEDIITLFEKKQIYLRPGLKVDDVARECMSNRTYVSNAINSYYGQTFSNLVNSFRIEYAKQLIITKSLTMKLSTIGLTAGFADEVSFIRNFKKFTGVTPSEWYSANVVTNFAS